MEIWRQDTMSPAQTLNNVESAARDLRRTYHRRVLDVLIRSVRGALDSIRRHTSVTSPRGKGGCMFGCVLDSITG
ncbi:hypothetical protein E2C01_053487 [Portunus trituberculatus]|uniref:Uncharacterized protein n=1 Tax=Portunus trituberculatus TaxID=210409 RepID=A0A5B7GQX3_PORTR|nr:hypothetical protein [Portunus trituberculatus]